MAYDFSQLNDKEFEELGIDLISNLIKIRLERFKPGKDSGVDGRFFSDREKESIVQVKHYLHSGYQKLIAKLKNYEKEKVERLKPSRYLLITSLPLSRLNKDEIKSIFHPYIKSSKDIIGQEDLNDLLKTAPKIEERYFKLWISSMTVFNRILNKAIKERSEFELEKIKSKTKLYVQTECHIKALTMLEKNNVLIISGEPGIGKTTLAENLCFFFTSKDYEFYSIEESLSEAENIYDRDSKQVFYFDDFLGSNYFEAIENKKDSHIVKFIERIKNDAKKIFILTSRTSILNSGLLHSDIFFNSKLNKNEYLLSIGDFSNLDKAKILYNHIWYSKLDDELLNKFFENRKYREIISHKNYNPRIIEFITDAERVTSTQEKYWRYVLDTLDNPVDIWNNYFKIQTNDYVRNLVILAVFNGGSIYENELKDSFLYLIKIENITNPSHTEKDFNSVAQLASKSFLNRIMRDGVVYYSLFNPSIADFILREYCNNSAKLTNVFLALCTVKSLDNLQSLLSEKIISVDLYNRIHESLIIDDDLFEKNHDYILNLMHSFRNDIQKKKIIIQYLVEVTTNKTPVNDIEILLNLVYLFKTNFKHLDSEYFKWIIHNYSMDKESLKTIMNFVVYLNLEDSDLISVLKNETEDYLENSLEEIASDIDVNEFIGYYSDEYGNDATHHDVDGLHTKIVEKIEAEFFDFNIKVMDLMGLSVEYYYDNIDAQEVIEDYYSSQENYEPDFMPDYQHSEPNISIDPIDDLFERT